MHDRVVRVFTDPVTMRLIVIFTFVSALLFRLVVWDLVNALSKDLARRKSAKQSSGHVSIWKPKSEARQPKL